MPNNSNLLLIKINELINDPSFDKDRLLITGDKGNGDMYKITSQDIVDLVVSQLASQSVSFSGIAVPTTDPGAPSNPVFYFAFEEGTYTNFKDDTDTAIEVGENEPWVMLVWDGNSWLKQLLDFPNILTKTDIANNLESTSVENPLSANMGKVINDKITYPGEWINEYEEVDFPQEVPGSVKAYPDGSFHIPDGAYYWSGYIPVTPGQTIIYNGTLGKFHEQEGNEIGYAVGIAGYDKNKNYLSDNNPETNYPIGYIWGRDIDENNNPESVSMADEDVELTIPDDCYYIAACCTIGGYNSIGFEIKKQIEKDIKNAISTVERGNMFTWEDIVKGKWTVGSPIEANTGNITTMPVVDSTVTDYLPVTPGAEIIVSLTMRGNVTKDNYPVTGIAGYDKDKNYLSDTGEDGFPIGMIMSQDYAIRQVGTNEHPAGKGIKVVDKKVKLPDNCYYLRGSSNINSTSYTPLVIKVKDNVNIFDYVKDNTSSFQSKILSHYIARSYAPSVNSGKLKRFSFVHFSDVHYGSGEDQKPRENMAEMTSFVNKINAAHIVDREIYVQLDCAICTGDVCQGTHGRDKNTTVGEITDFVNDYKKINIPKLNLKGNHDDNGNILSHAHRNINTIISNSDLYDLMFKDFLEEYPNIFAKNEGECYYYADFSTRKIRIIALDCYSWPRPVDSEGGIDFDTINNFYSQAQIDWLYTTLNNTPTDYAVIVLNHGTIAEGYDFDGYLQGWDFIPSIIDAWVNGTSYNHSFTDPNGGGVLDTSKMFDFRERGQGEFICYLSGHTHDFDVNANKYFPYQHHITIPCLKMLSSVGRNSRVYNKSGLVRYDTDEMRNSFGLVSVDREFRKIFYTVYGAFRDSMGNYNNRTQIIDY